MLDLGRECEREREREREREEKRNRENRVCERKRRSPDLSWFKLLF
jgi:hypothetical protein